MCIKQRSNASCSCTEIAEQQYSNGRYGPGVVGIVHIAFYGCNCISTNFGCSNHTGKNTLLGTELSDCISPCPKLRQIWGNDQVLETTTSLAGGGLGTIFNCWNYAGIQHLVVENGVPPAASQPFISCFAGASFKSYFYFKIAVN